MESVQKLTHIEHILKRPDSYVGPVDLNVEPYWVLNSNKSQFEKKNLKYSPALLKIFDEILVNAIDRNSMHPKNVTSISVDIDKESGAVTIENNGPLGGISVRMHEKEGIWNPELVFSHLLTSTHYDENQKRIVGRTEALAGFLFEFAHALAHVVHQAVGQAALFEEGEAGGGREDETGRHVEVHEQMFRHDLLIAQRRSGPLSIAVPIG